MTHCPHCGASLADPWSPSCPSCGAALSAYPPPLPPPAAPGAAWGGPAWEQPGDFVRRFLDTTQAVLFQPTAFYRSLGPGSVAPSLFYAAIMAGISILIGLGSMLAFNFVWSLAFQSQDLAQLGPLFAVMAGVGALQFLVMQTIYFVVRVLVLSLIAHGVLSLIATPRAPLDTTLRVYCYAQAASLFLIIPGIGGLVSMIYVIVLEVIGLIETQGVTPMQATLAVLAPVLFCCCCCAIAGVSFLAPILAAIGTAAGTGRP